MDEQTIQNLLAQANQQASPAQVAEAQKANQQEVNSNPSKEAQLAQQQAQPSQEPQEALTPEQERAKALEILAKYEKAQVNDKTGEVTLEEGKKVEQEENKGEEEDISKLPLEEQIKILQDKLAKERGEEPQEADPLAKVEENLEEAGLDLKDYEKEYLESGELSEESLASLKKAGYDKVAIDAYIAVREAKEEAKADTIIKNVMENRENFESMIGWMQENLSEAEITKYNEGVQTEHAEVYLKDMYNRYTQENSHRTIRGGQPRTTNDASQTFTSEFDMVKAMADPRYENDPSYRKAVRAKAMKMGM